MSQVDESPEVEEQVINNHVIHVSLAASQVQV